MKTALRGILAAAVIAAVGSKANAADITINEVAGTTFYTTGFTDFSVTSSQMNGMLVTAYWTVGGVAQGPQTQAWNSGVTFTGSNFDLVVSGDTFSNNAWQLDFSVNGAGLLQKLEFNGIPGNTVFDRTFTGTGTAGSDQGKDLAGFGPYEQDCGFFCVDEGNITATYWNRVALPFAAPVGDVFTHFSMEFLSFGGLGEGTDWQFSLDTDIAPGGVTPNPTGIPEPTTLMLFGVALVSVARKLRARRG